MSSISPLHAARLHYKPTVPRILRDLHETAIQEGEATSSVADSSDLKQRFSHTFGQPEIHLGPGTHFDAVPKTVGVVLSGGQAAGGHNVIAGLFDGLQKLHKDSHLIGFIGGPSGIVENQAIDITSDLLDNYRNMGGFDIIGSGRTKIETDDQLAAALETVQKRGLDGLVVIGGDDSNTNAALLAEYFKANNCKTGVIGIPKTIDGDLKNDHIEISFGHDTACRIYSDLIGNIARDALSARKYYHFIRLMGRSASHITLECALQTHPNITLIGEEVQEKRLTLRQIAQDIVQSIEGRAKAGKKFGIILIPEGLIEFIPEMKSLIAELNDLLAKGGAPEQLSASAQKTYQSLPKSIQAQLLIDRDPHGNVQVSRIETEQLLIEMCQQETKFSAVHHFFGYEGRSAFPSHFDCAYCYALGLNASRLIQADLTGYMSAVRNLSRPVEEWSAGGVPITMMMNLERRHGKDKPVIQKALVDLQGPAFHLLEKHRKEWGEGESYRFPGPIQFAGDIAITDQLPITLSLEKAQH